MTRLDRIEHQLKEKRALSYDDCVFLWTTYVTVWNTLVKLEKSAKEMT